MPASEVCIIGVTINFPLIMMFVGTCILVFLLGYGAGLIMKNHRYKEKDDA